MRMWEKKRVLLPEELRALLAVDASTNDAIARDLWIDTGWRLSDLIRANVGGLRVSEDEGVLDTVELVVDPPPSRHKFRRLPKTALLTPDVVERLLGLLETRRVATHHPLLVDRGGRRYTS